MDEDFIIAKEDVNAFLYTKLPDSTTLKECEAISIAVWELINKNLEQNKGDDTNAKRNTKNTSTKES